MIDIGSGRDSVRVQRFAAPMELRDGILWRPRWKILKYEDDRAVAAGRPYEVVEFGPNLLLNAGITVALNLIGGVSATAFSNANARIGVGDSTTAAAATQTGLQAATNKTYVAVDTGYPSVSAQSATWQSTFASADANYAWEEFVVDNGTTALNRLVSSQGTKASGQSWVVQLKVTLS